MDELFVIYVKLGLWGKINFQLCYRQAKKHAGREGSGSILFAGGTTCAIVSGTTVRTNDVVVAAVSSAEGQWAKYEDWQFIATHEHEPGQQDYFICMRTMSSRWYLDCGTWNTENPILPNNDHSERLRSFPRGLTPLATKRRVNWETVSTRL